MTWGWWIPDEVHYLADANRGTAWEETIIYMPKQIQLLCLSATVGNPDDLAGWIEEVHCARARRRGAGPLCLISGRCRCGGTSPCARGACGRASGPLLNRRRGDRMHPDLWPFVHGSSREAPRSRTRGSNGWSIETTAAVDRAPVAAVDPSRAGAGRGCRSRRPRASRTRPRGRRGRRVSLLVPHVETVVGQLVAADLLPAVWFIFSRKGCDQAVEYLCQCGASSEETTAERRKIAEALTAFETDNPDAVRPEAVEPLLLGIASHHAGLLPGWKDLVESLFQQGAS